MRKLCFLVCPVTAFWLVTHGADIRGTVVIMVVLSIAVAALTPEAKS